MTGANGHLGYTLTRTLLGKGYRVRATVRNPQEPGKATALRELGVELVEADLADPASLDAALEGMDGLFQVAAVFSLTAQDPQEEVIRPNVDGTRNVLEAAKRAGIRKVVYTSSIASVGTVAPGEAPLDESRWNDRAIEPYAISKTRSEKLAWEIAESLGISLVTVLPGTIIGPNFGRLTASLQLVRDILDGKVPMAMPLSLSYVDVRDVARAHVLVYEDGDAKGRYIATGETLSVSEVIRIVKSERPSARTSAKVMPSWLARAVPAMDYLASKFTGAARSMKSEVVREYLGRLQIYCSSRLKDEFGWTARPADVSLRETIDWMSWPEFALR